MKKFLILTLGLSLFVSSATQALEVIRDGQAIVIKAPCMAINLNNLSQRIPQGVTTFPELMAIFVSSLRNFTAQERAMCTGDQIAIPLWRVAKNKGSVSRPVYLLNAKGSRVKTAIRANIGDECENKIPTYSKSSSAGKEWRYLANQTEYVVLCEYN